MKTFILNYGHPLGTLLIVAAILVFLFASGCTATRIKVVTPDGIKVTASFPKDMQATNLLVRIGDYQLSADTLNTNASAVAREKNKGVTAVAGAVSDVAKAVTIP